MGDESNYDETSFASFYNHDQDRIDLYNKIFGQQQILSPRGFRSRSLMCDSPTNQLRIDKKDSLFTNQKAQFQVADDNHIDLGNKKQLIDKPEQHYIPSEGSCISPSPFVDVVNDPIWQFMSNMSNQEGPSPSLSHHTPNEKIKYIPFHVNLSDLHSDKLNQIKNQAQPKPFNSGKSMKSWNSKVPLKRMLSKITTEASKMNMTCRTRMSFKTKRSDGQVLGKRSTSSFSKHEKKSSIDRTIDYISDQRFQKTRGKSESNSPQRSQCLSEISCSCFKSAKGYTASYSVKKKDKDKLSTCAQNKPKQIFSTQKSKQATELDKIEKAKRQKKKKNQADQNLRKKKKEELENLKDQVSSKEERQNTICDILDRNLRNYPEILENIKRDLIQQFDLAVVDKSGGSINQDFKWAYIQALVVQNHYKSGSGSKHKKELCKSEKNTKISEADSETS